MTTPLFKVLALAGTFTLDKPNTDELVLAEFTIKGGSGVNIEAINPSKGLYSTPMITSSGFGQYSTARTIEELQSAVQDQYPNVYWWLFNLVAVYKNLSLISFNVEGTTWTAYIETAGKSIYSWVNPSQAGSIFVIEKPNDLPAVSSMDPSEIMQAFTTAAEHMRMGSKQFMVRVLEEQGKFIVSFFDHEMLAQRVDVDFRLRLLGGESTLPK